MVPIAVTAYGMARLAGKTEASARAAVPEFSQALKAAMTPNDDFSLHRLYDAVERTLLDELP